MISVLGQAPTNCDGVTRREVLRVGGLALGGLTLPDLLRLRAKAGTANSRPKSVIMIWLRGGPSHIDSYDMKPDAPLEVRGEFQPIETNVPGIQICEYLPLHAQIMDKLTIVRGIKSNDLGDHTPHYILTGCPDRGKRPPIGSIVSRLHPRHDGVPPYASLMYDPRGLENPTYAGMAHRPFVPRAEGLDNLSLAKGISIDRLRDRQTLHRELDRFSRAADLAGNMAGMDGFTRQALEMVLSPVARRAFNVNEEPPETHARYGKYCESLLMARRLVEAGVNVVTLKLGDWDTHEHNFRDMRDQLPQLDRGFHALISDLYERGLQRDVAVVLWGEFGRAPRVSRIAGRDHWPDAGAAVLAGGGFKVGQVLGETDAHAARSKGRPDTPANIFATLYRHLGIDPAITLPDHNGRPMYLLEDRESIQNL